MQVAREDRSFETLVNAKPRHLWFLTIYPTTLHTRLHIREMSRAAKLTLAGTSLGAMGIVVLVHYQQQAEKAVRSQAILTIPD